MNEALKAKIKEKMGAAVSDEDLDKVAGGTAAENWELLTAMDKIDSKGVQNVLANATAAGNDKAKFQELINEGVFALFNKNFGGNLQVFGSSEFGNIYKHKGNSISHKQMLDAIDAELSKRIKAAQDDAFVVM